MNLHKTLLLLVILSFSSLTKSQYVLLGDNAPFANVNDGDFSKEWGYWRQAKQSPCWQTKIIDGKEPMGLHYGSMFSMNAIGIAESILLDNNSEYQNPQAGDKIHWSFGADLEYVCNGSISLSLVFGQHERILAEKVKLIGSDRTIEHFSGTYTLNEEDVKEGFPFVRASFYSERDVKVYLHYVNISVEEKGAIHPELAATASDNSIALKWNDDVHYEASEYHIYRMRNAKEGYLKIGSTCTKAYADKSIFNGVNYTYLVTRNDKHKEYASNAINIRLVDKDAPLPPTNINSEVFDTEINLTWSKSINKDVEYYSLERQKPNGEYEEIANNIRSTKLMDFTPYKEMDNYYRIFAYDYSGNKSKPSEIVKARVKAIRGASFSDLILPIPIHNNLRSDIWGADNVIPRDMDNGIEHKDWTYWGGRPVEDKDNKYHMLVTRWPANAMKGHWEWPHSTVAHVVADIPTGPYKVKKELAYSNYEGLGHNPDIVLLNDGTYLLYSLINWQPTLFTSKTMNGPWKELGTMEIDLSTANPDDKREYQYSRNLSGVQLEDGSFLFVSKFGCMLHSKENPLGPYKVLTETINQNTSIPQRYRKSNYEDPVMWKDDIQYHLIINAFLDYRAIYLRSEDGINWKFEPGTAYTPGVTMYEDGTRTKWYKLERPHVLQDNYGRATHLSLAAIDVPKADDLAGDKHNSKNIIIPLTKHKRIHLLNKQTVDNTTKTISIKIISEEGFNAQKDIDIKSLKIGASELVNFGKGYTVSKTKKSGNDLIIEFKGEDNGLSETNFALKLIGKTKTKELIVAYCKRSK